MGSRRPSTTALLHSLVCNHVLIASDPEAKPATGDDRQPGSLSDSGYHVILEGILDSGRYGAMLAEARLQRA